MKITKSELTQIIKEELSKELMQERNMSLKDMELLLKKVYDAARITSKDLQFDKFLSAVNLMVQTLDLNSRIPFDQAVSVSEKYLEYFLPLYLKDKEQTIKDLERLERVLDDQGLTAKIFDNFFRNVGRKLGIRGSLEKQFMNLQSALSILVGDAATVVRTGGRIRQMRRKAEKERAAETKEEFKSFLLGIYGNYLFGSGTASREKIIQRLERSAPRRIDYDDTGAGRELYEKDQRKMIDDILDKYEMAFRRNDRRLPQAVADYLQVPNPVRSYSAVKAALMSHMLEDLQRISDTGSY